MYICSIGWGCRIHRLLLYREIRPPPNECPAYDTKQSDDEVPVILELKEGSVPLHCSQVQSQLCVVAPDMVQSIVQIELDFVLMLKRIV